MHCLLSNYTSNQRQNIRESVYLATAKPMSINSPCKMAAEGGTNRAPGHCAAFLKSDMHHAGCLRSDIQLLHHDWRAAGVLGQAQGQWRQHHVPQGPPLPERCL